MRHHLILLLLITIPIQAWSQSFPDIPELQTSYELYNSPYGYPISFLPRFDTARGGYNAISFAVMTPPVNVTWYNRFVADTTNMYSWPTSFLSVQQIDFNGDGILDYYTSSGELFPGVTNGVPPASIASRSDLPHYIFGSSFVTDLNADGNMDLVAASSSYPTHVANLGTIVVGKTDFSKMQTVNLPTIGDTSSGGSDEYQYLADAYSMTDGSLRIVTASKPKSSQIYRIVLWKVNFRVVNNQIMFERYDLLDATSNRYTLGASFHSVGNSYHTLKIGSVTYAAERDFFDTLFIDTIPSFWRKIPKGLVDTTSPGWFSHPLGSDTLYLLYYEGNPRTRQYPISKIKYGYPIGTDGGATLVTVQSLGDINHDGFGDLVATYQGETKGKSFNRLVAFLGRTAPTSVADNANAALESLELPALIRTNEAVPVRIKAVKEGLYSLKLFTLNGALVANLWEGLVFNKEQVTQFAPSLLHLSMGSYYIQLTGQNTRIDKTIIIAP